jgi:chromosomal replication initiator protein
LSSRLKKIETTHKKYIYPLKASKSNQQVNESPAQEENGFEKIWENCLRIIKDNVSSQSFKTWFEPIKPIKLQNKVLTIQVPSQFFYEWLEEHYITLLRKTLKNELGADGRLEYSIIMENNANSSKPYTVKIPTNSKKSLSNPSIAMPLDISSNAIRNPFVIPGLKKVNVESQLNPAYSFENFIEGDCNRLARSAGYAVANKPGGTAFNPLLIYGGVGLRKITFGTSHRHSGKKSFPKQNSSVCKCRSLYDAIHRLCEKQRSK